MAPVVLQQFQSSSTEWLELEGTSRDRLLQLPFCLCAFNSYNADYLYL